ncbi:MAG: hypothetical protein HQ564_05340 [Candidatus Saganbacteria bacterium]|nr:hypothetical protein [Candidatus Saganbacteria bacterium]
MPNVAGPQMRFHSMSRPTRMLNRLGNLAAFADRVDSHATIRELVSRKPEASPEIIKSLAALGIIKYRRSQEIKSMDDLHVEDLSAAITFQRWNQAMNSMGKMVQGEGIATTPPDSVLTRAVGTVTHSVSDTIFGIQTSLREAQELSGKAIGPENDPILAARPARAKKAALGVALAFSAALLTGCKLTSVTSTVSSVALGLVGGLTLSSAATGLLIGAVGVFGVCLLFKLAKSPAFWDSFLRSIFPVVTFGTSLYVRYLVVTSVAVVGIPILGIPALTGIPLWLIAMGASVGTVVGLNLMRGLLAHYLPFRVLGFGREAYRANAIIKNDPLLRAAAAKRNLSMDFIVRLRDAKNGTLDKKLWPNRTSTPSFSDVQQCANDLVAQSSGDTQDAAEEIRDMLNTAATLSAALEQLEEYHTQNTRMLPDMRTPSLLLTTGSRSARIFSWAYQVPMLLAFTSGGFSTINAMLFTAFAMCNFYYHLGTVWSMKLTESAEYVENHEFADFHKDADGTVSKPKIVTVRYSNKGILNRRKLLPPYMMADVENRVIYGKNYYVVFNNDSNNHYAYEVYGGVKIAQRIEARLHYMRESGIFDSLAGIQDEAERTRLMFALACREYELNPMQIVDNATNLLYPSAPSGGEAVRFRDGYSWFSKKMSKSIGDGGGENACYLAFKTMFEASGPLKSALYRIIVRENQLDLIGFHDPEKMEEIFGMLENRFGIDASEISRLRRTYASSKDDYMLEALQRMAVNSGMDHHRAHGIAYEIVKRSKDAVRWGKIAPLADRLLIGLDLTPVQRADLASNVSSAFGVDGDEVVRILNTNRSAIEENADSLIEAPNISHELFFKIWRYAQASLAIQRQGPKTEEGNLRRKIEYYDENRASLTTQQMEDFEFLARALDFDINNVDVESILGGTNAHCGLLIARAIQGVLINRGITVSNIPGRAESKRKRRRSEEISRNIGLLISKTAAEHQPGMAEYVAAATANPGLSIEAIDLLVWDNFMEELENLVPSTVDAAFSQAGLRVGSEERDLLVALALESAKDEFSNNKNEVFRVAVGFAHWMVSDLDGVRRLEDIVNSSTDLDNLYQLRDRCRDIRSQRDQALVEIRDLLDGTEEEKDTVMGELESGIDALMDLGVGSLPKTKGYNHLYGKLINLLPHVVQGQEPLTMDSHEWSKKITLIVSDSKRIIRVRKERKERLDIALEQFVGANAAERKVKNDMQIWVFSQLDPTKGDQGVVGNRTGDRENQELIRMVSEPTSLQVANSIVDQLIENPDIPRIELVDQNRITRDSLSSFKEGHRNDLWDLLINEGYIDSDGNISSAFDGIIDNFNLTVSLSQERDTEKRDRENESIKQQIFCLLSVAPVKVVNNMVESTTGNPAHIDRLGILRELNAEVSSRSILPTPPDTDLFDSFDSVYRYSRVWGFRWGHAMAKANNTNREMLGTRVYEQVGTHLRHIIKLHFTERQGFHRIPTFLSEKIKIDVVGQIAFHKVKNEDFNYKLARGLTQDDIARKLIAHMASGMTSAEAAAEVWAEIQQAFADANGTAITRDNFRVGRIESLRQNLIDCADETAILLYGGEVISRLQADNPSPAILHLNDLRRRGRITLSQSRQIRKMIREEHLALVKDGRLSLKIEQALADNNVELAMYYEQQLHHRDGLETTWAAHFRHNNKRPELVLNRPRSLQELAAWMTSCQRATDFSVENGELLADAKLLRDTSIVADELLTDLGTMTNGQIRTKYRLTSAIDGDLDILRYGSSDYSGSAVRLFNSFEQADGLELDERSETFITVLSAVLEVRETEQKAARRAEIDNPHDLEMNLDPPIVNALDDRRFPKAIFEQTKGDVQMNADTDNVFYPELMNSSSHFGYLWGLFANPNEVVQFGCNYETTFRSPFGRFQRDRDLGGPQNQSVIRANLAPFGKTRWRSSLTEFAGTLTGYANLLPMAVALQATEYVIETNNCGTSYKGQKALERFFGKGWWNKKKKTGKGLGDIDNWKYYLNRSPVHRMVGWEDGWDALMSGERWLRIIPTVAIAGLVLGNVINYAFGTIMETTTSFNASPLATVFEGTDNEWGIGLGTIAAASLGVWALCKGFAGAFGRSIDFLQYTRGRRVYVIDPSEDLATTLPLRIKGFKLTLAKGFREMNDAMTEYDGDMGQKLRWQAQNAANIWRVLKYIRENRDLLTTKEAYDLLQGPLYNMFGIPGRFNRWAILLFVFLGEPSILIGNLPTSLQNNLGWLVELGFINYLGIEFMLRMSRMKQGASWSGAGSNFGYETTMIGFNYTNVMRRAFSGAKFGFNVTDPPEEPCQIKPPTWREAETLGDVGKVGWLYSRLDGTLGFLFRNKLMMGLEGYALYRLGQHVADGLGSSDFFGIYMGTLLFWIGSRLYYNIRGHRLNTGISNVPYSERSWQVENQVWGKEWGK